MTWSKSAAARDMFAAKAMDGGDYTVGEVLFYLQMTHGQALDLDAFPKDSLCDLSEDPHGGGSAEAGPPLFHVLRWHDVHTARGQVCSRKQTDHIIRLRAAGFTEDEVARVMDIDRRTLRRRFRATLAEIVAELGGNPFSVGVVEARVEARLHQITRAAA